jgi:metal-responsive CopG/Arc/MetJ family transcriptional regulator
MRSATINLSLPAPLLRLIDEEAKAELRTRSELIREATRMYLAREQRWKSLQRYASQRARASGVRTEQDVLRVIGSLRRGSRGPTG